jgi:hypothetical protein
MMNRISHKEQLRRTEENRYLDRILIEYLLDKKLMPSGMSHKKGRHYALSKMIKGYNPSKKTMRELSRYIIENGTHLGYNMKPKFSGSGFYASEKMEKIKS